MTVLRQIHGHIEAQRAEAREHFAEHLEELAKRIRSSSLEPVGVAALVLLEDGSQDYEMCCGGQLEALALSASLDSLRQSLQDDEGDDE